MLAGRASSPARGTAKEGKLDGNNTELELLNENQSRSESSVFRVSIGILLQPRKNKFQELFMKLVKFMYLSLLFTACIDGGIIKDDMDNSKPPEDPKEGSIPGKAYYYEDQTGDNSGITVTLKKKGSH